MTQQEFFKIWENKYVKSYIAFDKYFMNLKCWDNDWNGQMSPVLGQPAISYIKDDNTRTLDRKVLPFEMISGVIEKFFEDNNIYGIYVIPFIIALGKIGYRSFVFNISISKHFFNSKQKAQMKAYLKAAEILEKRRVINNEYI